ncbi:msx2-interacting protein-like isoform X2 [Paramacrobiotus metropolitanus]|uniref:msx2-interacting protein-like isoform X2 n=1 Tax=Paramacrobiotus metropolitanus TaxID=2943436 RepID=UPI0024464177|nr:msx2-interacting protein-like isoform X2 [Paramacrobiotus metropolitanus]
MDLVTGMDYGVQGLILNEPPNQPRANVSSTVQPRSAAASSQPAAGSSRQSYEEEWEQLRQLERISNAGWQQQSNQGPSGMAMQPGPSMSTNSFPVVWQGQLALKNDHALVRMHIISGNQELSRLSLPGFPDPTHNVLKISQRMPLEQAQLHRVSSQMNDTDAHCVLVACATGKSAAEQAHEGDMLRNGFVNYFTGKQAAGIVNVALHGPNSPIQYVIHFFPPCDFSNQALARFGPSVMQAIPEQQPHLFVVITKSWV